MTDIVDKTIIPFEIQTIKPRIAVCFFGLTRSLRQTHDSLKKNVLDILRQVGYELDVYLHTYSKTELTNKRSAEFGCRLDTEEWKLLEPLKFEIESPEAVQSTLNWDRFRKYRDAWQDNFASLTNFGFQLHSLSRVTTLWETSGIQYSAVVYLRPDQLYHDPFDIGTVQRAISETSLLITPSWGKFTGLNDRFAIASPAAARVYGHRIRQADAFCAERRRALHSESLLAFASSKANLKLEYTNVRASRVRANGRVENEGFNFSSHHSK